MPDANRGPLPLSYHTSKERRKKIILKKACCFSLVKAKRGVKGIHWGEGGGAGMRSIGGGCQWTEPLLSGYSLSASSPGGGQGVAGSPELVGYWTRGVALSGLVIMSTRGTYSK